ncbi:hypothetical protein WJ970_23215 [Achromobacter xylosoxidans]
MRIKQPVEHQIVHGREPDAAHLCAAGVDLAIDAQAAAVGGDDDVPGADFVADRQVPDPGLETAGSGDAGLGEAAIQTAEILDGLPFQLDAAVFEGHIGAAGIVFAAGAAQQLASQRDQASRRAHGRRAQAACVVIGGGNVHDRSGRLNYVARLAFQLDIAAPAVTGLVEQRRAAPGHVDARAVAQRDVPFGPHAQFAAGQGDGAVQRDAVRDQVQRSADGRGADRLSRTRQAQRADRDA